MKKSIGLLLAMMAVSLVFMSCDDSESYADKLKRERKLVKQLISEKGFVIVNEIPTDTIFAENVYYHDKETDIYFNIEDRGDLTLRASKETGSNTKVHCRFDRVRVLGDTTNYGYPASQPMSFMYGIKDTYRASDPEVANYYLTPAYAFPLDYVGEGAVVNLIVPFDEGSTNQQSYYTTLFVQKLRYTKFW